MIKFQKQEKCKMVPYLNYSIGNMMPEHHFDFNDIFSKEIIIVFNKPNIQHRMFKQKSTYPSEHEQLDLSSIQDQSNSNDKSNSNIDIQQMRLEQIDEEDFKNNVRELLLTENFQQQDAKQDQDKFLQQYGPKDQIEQNQFQGEPLKGSFLRDMEVLGKTLSFQSTVYNIYEQRVQNEDIVLQQLLKSKISQKSLLYKNIEFKNLSKYSIGLQAKYIIDFQKIEIKSKKSKKNCSKKKYRPASSLITEGTNCVKSQNHFYKKDKSVREFSKNKRKQSSKASRQNCQQHKHVDYNSFINSIKKGGASPSLRKVGYNSITSQNLKGKKSQPSSLLQKQQRRKRIQQKFSLGPKC